MSNIGSRIYSMRSKMGLSQQDLADKLGVSRQSVSKWETCTALPELDKLIAMSELFGLTLDEMVGKETPRLSFVPQTNALAPQKLIGIILMAVCLLATPLFIAFVGEWGLWLLILLPLLAMSAVLMLSNQNTMYKCVLSLMWPAGFISTWSVYFLPVSVNVMLCRLITSVAVLLLTKRCFRSDKHGNMKKSLILLCWAGYLLFSAVVTQLVLTIISGDLLIWMYLTIEPVMLLMAAFCSIKTVQNVWNK